MSTPGGPVLSEVLASLSEPPPAARKAQPIPLTYGVTIYLGSARPPEHTVDPELLADAQANPSAYAAPAVVKVRLVPPPAKPAPKPAQTFGEMMRAAAAQA